jgi:hypothetical protein
LRRRLLDVERLLFARNHALVLTAIADPIEDLLAAGRITRSRRNLGRRRIRFDDRGRPRCPAAKDRAKRIGSGGTNNREPKHEPNGDKLAAPSRRTVALPLILRVAVIGVLLIRVLFVGILFVRVSLLDVLVVSVLVVGILLRTSYPTVLGIVNPLGLRLVVTGLLAALPILASGFAVGLLRVAFVPIAVIRQRRCVQVMGRGV